MDTVTRQCPQTTTFLKTKESRSGIEPRPFCLPALPLGQTGSHSNQCLLAALNTDGIGCTRFSRVLGLSLLYLILVDSLRLKKNKKIEQTVVWDILYTYIVGIFNSDIISYIVRYIYICRASTRPSLGNPRPYRRVTHDRYPCMPRQLPGLSAHETGLAPQRT